MDSDILISAVVFYGLYHIFKLFTDFLLKGKLIKAEQYDRSGILESPASSSEESNKYPSLKWGLVALMTGIGFIVIEVMRQINPALIDYHNAVLPIGILLIFTSLGFLIYFFLMKSNKV